MTKAKEQPIIGFHFIKRKGKLDYDNKKAAEVGGTERFNGTPILCQKGLHASRKLKDAYGYMKGLRVRVVKSWGTIHERHDKYATQYRKILSSRDLAPDMLEIFKTCNQGDPVWDNMTLKEFRKTGNWTLNNINYKNADMLNKLLIELENKLIKEALLNS